MPSFYFIKLYDDILDDHKMGHLPDRLWRRAVEFFLLANRERNKGESDDGFLPTVSEMAWTLRCTPEEVERDLQELHDQTNCESRPIVQCVDGRWFVTRFAHRQEPVSDAERKKRQRERDRQESQDSHDDVTSRDTESESDQESESESELELESDNSRPGDDVAAAYALLESFAVDEPARTECAKKYSAERIADAIALAMEKKNLKNPQGYVVTVLKSGEPIPKARAPADPATERKRKYARPGVQT